MKIAIIMGGQALEPGGGVRMQGLMWRDGLLGLGHDVSLVNFWEEYNWKLFDAIIVLQMTGIFDAVISQMCKNNPNILFAPILDPGPSATLGRYKFLAKTMSRVCNSKIGRICHLSSEFTKLYDNTSKIRMFLTRSNQETDYVSYCFDVDKTKIAQVPLSLRFNPLDKVPITKESFCFHVSRLASPNKNVTRLIEAAKKYGFNLKLAGYLHGESETNWLHNQINGSSNIEYVGTLNDNDLKNYYRRAKVFALPSYTEGVGMVAMEAAAYGCEIVLTNLGAPKDYYNGMAELVNPFSVDDIGIKIMKCLESGKSQPFLLDYIKSNYSLMACSIKLENAIRKAIEHDGQE